MRQGFLSLILAATITNGVIGNRALSEEPEGQKRTMTEHIYATIDGEELKLDLWMPSEVKSPPLLVWVHGGAWRSGSRKNPKVKALVEDS